MTTNNDELKSELNKQHRIINNISQMKTYTGIQRELINLLEVDPNELKLKIYNMIAVINDAKKVLFNKVCDDLELNDTDKQKELNEFYNMFKEIDGWEVDLELLKKKI